MPATDLLDEVIAEQVYDQFAQLHIASQLAVKDMVELTDAALKTFKAFENAESMAEFSVNAKSADANTKNMVSSTTNYITTLQKADALISQYNGHSLETVKVMKEVALTQKTNTQETILQTKEQERLAAAADKRAAQLLKEQSAYNKLNAQYKEAAALAKDLGAQYEIDGRNAATFSEAQAAAFTELGEKMKVAQAEALGLRQALFGINNAIGDATLNVGNYPTIGAEISALRERLIQLEVAAKADNEQMQILATRANELRASLSGPSSGSSFVTITSELQQVNAQMDTLKEKTAADNAEFEQLVGRVVELKAAVANVGIAVTEAGEKSVAAGEGMALAFEKVGTTLKDIGKFAVAFFGVQLGLEFISGITEEFGKADDAARKLQNTLDNAGNGNAFGRITQQAQELSDKLNYLDTYEVQGVFDKLITYGKLTEQQMKELVPVVIDFAAKQGISINEAATTITKALEGSGRALKAYGIDIKDAASATETAASPAERLSLIMTELKPRVEGAGAAFAEGFSGRIAGLKKDLREIELAISDFFVKLSGVEEASLQNAISARKEADETTKLVAEYEELSKKVNQTSQDKARLSEITSTLTTMYGNSVISIDKETGAIELNIAATKDLIKQKLLLNSQEASKYAQQYEVADEKRKQNADELTKAQLAYNDAVKRTGVSIEDVHAISYTKGGQIIDNQTPDEKQIIKLNNNVNQYKQLLDKYLNDKIEAADKLRALGFEEGDVDKLFNPSAPIKPRPGANDNKPKATRDDTLKNEQELTKRAIRRICQAHVDGSRYSKGNIRR